MTIEKELNKVLEKYFIDSNKSTELEVSRRSRWDFSDYLSGLHSKSCRLAKKEMKVSQPYKTR